MLVISELEPELPQVVEFPVIMRNSKTEVVAVFVSSNEFMVLRSGSGSYTCMESYTMSNHVATDKDWSRYTGILTLTNSQ